MSISLYWLSKFFFSGQAKPKKAAKKTTKKKKKPTASHLLNLDDTSESEVALDSLGLFFNHLIDTAYYQAETGASQAVEEEVTIISSGSESLTRQKLQQVTRKVRFSHPLAYLDPHFLLKRQQHESYLQTRTSGGDELSSGLPNTPAPRKRRNEVFKLEKFFSSVNGSCLFVT